MKIVHKTTFIESILHTDTFKYEHKVKHTLTAVEEVTMGLEKIYRTHTCTYTEVIVFLWDAER